MFVFLYQQLHFLNTTSKLYARHNSVGLRGHDRVDYQLSGQGSLWTPIVMFVPSFPGCRQVGGGGRYIITIQEGTVYNNDVNLFVSLDFI